MRAGVKQDIRLVVVRYNCLLAKYSDFVVFTKWPSPALQSFVSTTDSYRSFSLSFSRRVQLAGEASANMQKMALTKRRRAAWARKQLRQSANLQVGIVMKEKSHLRVLSDYHVDEEGFDEDCASPDIHDLQL